MSNADLPLSGVRILDVATFVAAPYCATILSEFGAEVIKVEEPARGDPFRRFGTATERADSTLAWLSEARNKKSITLNLRTSEGATLFRRLIHYADVIGENFRPGTLERWGLGWDELSGINPKLILLRMTGYGQTGPHRDRPGFARIAHAIGGLAALAGMPDGPPVTPGSTSLGDYLAGLYGAVGVLIALLHVRAGGPGQVVDIGLYEAVFRVLDELAPAYARAGIVREREGAGTRNACPHGTPPRLVTTGRVVAVGTSGGISMLGMLATLTGGAMIGLAAGLLPHGILWSIALPLGLLSGLAGSLIDSLLGASLQRQGYCPSCQAATEARIHHCGAASKLTRGCSWLGNDAVNFLASLAGGLIALVFWLCLIGIGA